MVTDALNEVVAALDSHDISATVDPPKINPPAAWVAGRRLERTTLALHYAVVVDVYLIARDNGIPTALDVLDQLLTDALAAADQWGLVLDSSDLGEAVTLPQGGGPMPAYRLTFIVDPDT